MADVNDVVAALCAGIDAILYPNGDGAAPLVGAAISIVDGWPLPADLDKLVGDFNASPSVPRGWVSVWPNNDEQNRTKYAEDWEVLTPAPAPGLTITIDETGTEATIGGTAPGADGPTTLIGLVVNRQRYPYKVLPSDMPDTIATALAALINAATPASAAGQVVTVPGAFQLLGRVGTFTILARETRRQGRTFRVVMWAGSDVLREAIAQVVDVPYSTQQWIALSDGTGGRIRYLRSPLIEDEQKAGLYRREIWFDIEYPTIVTQAVAPLLFPTLELEGGFTGLAGPFGPEITLTE